MNRPVVHYDEKNAQSFCVGVVCDVDDDFDDDVDNDGS